MGEARILLKLMNPDGELIEKVYHDGQTPCIQLTINRFDPFHSQESQVGADRQLARFHVSSSCRLILEPFCEGVEVEPAHPEPNAAGIADSKIVVPYSKPAENSHHYIHLRPEDVVYFENHHRRVRYSVHVGYPRGPETKMPPAISGDEDVQVKSSDPGTAVKMHADQRSAADSETEDEGDADRTSAPMSVTPATSRLIRTREIKETPKHRHLSEEDAPFSTAQEPPVGVVGDQSPLPAKNMPSSELEGTRDAIEAAGASSPAAQAHKQRTSRAGPSQSRIQSFSQSDLELPSSLKTPNRKYGKNNRRTIPAKSADGTESEAALERQQQLPSEDSDEDDARGTPQTSQNMLPKGPAYEAAARSMSSKRKAVPNSDSGASLITKARKLSEDTGADAGQHADTSAVTARTSLSSKSVEADDGGEITADVAVTNEEYAESATAGEESDDDGPSQIPAGPRVSSERLPKIAQGGESEGDEIVVKSKKKAPTQTKLSPEMVVRPQRASKSARKTPAGTPSSTANSSFSGKPPKVITSQFKPSPAHTKFLTSQGSLTINTIPSRRTNFVCVVGKGKKLVTAPKVLRSLALGKRVVTERWISDSVAAKDLLDPATFVHEELAGTISVDRRNLFFGKVLFFTNAAVEAYGSANWIEMKELARETGASYVDSGTAGKGGSMTDRHTIIYLGVDKDQDANALITDYDRAVYHKDMIKGAVISGELDLEDDKHKLKTTAEKKKGRR